LDGQTLATERIASLLEGRFDVHRLNTQAPEGAHVRTDGGFSISRLRHYVGLRATLRVALSEAPTAPVLWNSISPIPLGHWRDVLTTLPAFQIDQPVHAVMHRATYERLLNAPLTAPTARRIVDRMTSFVFLSEHLAASCARWIPAPKRVVIPNTIDDEVLCTRGEVEDKQAAFGGDRPFRLLFVSNMLPEKGYLDVLRAVGRLRERGFYIEADFVGGWPSDAARLTFEREAKPLAVSVRHHGPIADRAAIKALHLAADAFVLPTYHPTETQPKAILEALNAGTPVVATERPIMDALVGDGIQGYLVPPRAPEAIAAAVERLQDPESWRALSRRARARFEACFAPEAVGAQWNTLLDRRT
jgi:glycosyltransferase involved in cell wall biosynthesis